MRLKTTISAKKKKTRQSKGEKIMKENEKIIPESNIDTSSVDKGVRGMTIVDGNKTIIYDCGNSNKENNELF